MPPGPAVAADAETKYEAAVPALVMVGAALNALVVRAVEAVATGTETASLGVGPFQLVTLFVATRLAFGHGASGGRRFAAFLDAATLALVLVPSSAVSWLALAGYAGLRSIDANGERRQGALLFLALALASLWSSVVLKWIAAPVTAAEAFALGKLLALVRPDIVQTGNVVGNPDTHSLILMTRCTTADALPAALVALAAVALLVGRPDARSLIRAGAGLAIVLAAANAVRLAAMAWSAENYALVHGVLGANVYDALQVLAVLGFASRAARL